MRSAPTPSSGCSRCGGTFLRAPTPSRYMRSSRRAVRRGSRPCTHPDRLPGRRRHIPSLAPSNSLGRLQTTAHRPRAVGLLDLLETVRLEDMHRRAVRGDAEAHRLVALLPRHLDQRVKELGAGAAAAPARHHRHRNLRRLLVDEAEARLVALEQSVPGRADGETAFERDYGAVTAPAPAGDIAPQRSVL